MGTNEDYRISVGAKRSRRSENEAAEDERWLRWIGQHRFVDVRALARRFAVSVRAAWRRIGRLIEARLLASRRAGAITIFFLAARAVRLLDLPRRHAPRAPLVGLSHELAIARWHAELEIALAEQGTAGVVLTERGLRERHHPDRPCCTSAAIGGGRVAQRWADVAIELPDGRLRAYELEFADKSKPRLQAIVRGYRAEPRIESVTYLVDRPARGRRLASIVAAENAQDKIAVQPWLDLSDAVADDVRRQVRTVATPLATGGLAAN